MTAALLSYAELGELARHWTGAVGPLSPLPSFVAIAPVEDDELPAIDADVAGVWADALATLAHPTAMVGLDGTGGDVDGRVATYHGQHVVTLVCGPAEVLVLLDEGTDEIDALAADTLAQPDGRARLVTARAVGAGVSATMATAWPAPDGDRLLVEDADGIRRSTLDAFLARDTAADGPPPAAPASRASRPPRTRVLPMVRRVLALTSLLVGLGSTGVGAVNLMQASDAEEAVVATDVEPLMSEPESEVLPDGDAATAPCRNDVFGWTLDYPTGWYVADTTPELDCTHFDEEPVDPADAGAGGPMVVAMRISPLGRSFDVAVEQLRGTSELELTSEGRPTVGGAPAFRFTGDARGDQVAGYIFTVHGKAFWAEAWSHHADDFESAEFVLDQVMASLRPL